VQEALEQALAALTGEPHRTDFAGRTDAGVHAVGQVAAFTTSRERPLARWVQGLNHFLPPAVAVQDARIVPLEFDPRRHARDRTYRYDVRLATVRQPLWAGRAWVFRGRLDQAAMRDAAARLLGRHDFASFCAKPGGADTERTLAHVALAPLGEDGRTGVRFVFRAESFLHHQIRLTVGQLVRVGLGRAEPAVIDRLLARPRIGAAGPKAPPQGLTLMRVGYSLPALADWNDDEDVCAV